MNQENTVDHADTGSGMEAASKALQQLGILKPTEMVTSNVISSSGDADKIQLLRKNKAANPESLTPTVVLNGLAMSRGETVSYKIVKRTALPRQPLYETGFYNKIDRLSWTNMYYYQHSYENRFIGDRSLNSFPRPIKRWIYPFIFCVEVTVGDHSFTGEAKSQQAARHNAAQQALEVLQAMPVPDLPKKLSSGRRSKQGGNERDAAETKSIVKSPISLLYEKASGSRLKVKFDIVNEEGPPHLKYFTMMATVFKDPSEVVIVAEGQGMNKITAKTKAAVAALEQFESVPLPVKKTLIPPDAKAAAVISSNILHPCSRLNQILQIKHEQIPTYTLISSEETAPGKTKFIIECTAMDQSATGEGQNKKDAKRIAAENLLKKLGFYSQSSRTPPAKLSTRNVQAKRKSKYTATDILPPLMEDIFLTIRRQKTTIFTDAKESTLVSELKKIIEGILKIAPEDQMLYKDDQALDDNKTLADSGFTSQTAKAQSPGMLGLAAREGDAFETLTMEPYSTPPELPDVMKTHDGIAEQKK